MSEELRITRYEVTLLQRACEIAKHYLESQEALTDGVPENLRESTLLEYDVLLTKLERL